MDTARTKIPEDSTLLCETCGYTLTGLPPTARCPECGHEIAESLAIHRHPAIWERSGNAIGRFVTTTLQVLFQPTRFYRTLASRRPRRGSVGFALIHWLLASLLFGWAAEVHVNGFFYFDSPLLNDLVRRPWLLIAIFTAITFTLFAFTTPIAARLTAFEARYRGLRLPLPVVQRSLDFHAADYLPVAFLTCLTIVGYRWLVDRRYLSSTFDAKYLYLLCAEVIVFAVYLFNAYWIGMRKLMYANS